MDRCTFVDKGKERRTMKTLLIPTWAAELLELLSSTLKKSQSEIVTELIENKAKEVGLRGDKSARI